MSELVLLLNPPACLCEDLSIINISLWCYGKFNVYNLKRSISGIMVDTSIVKDPNDMAEEERIAEMGKPKLGEIDKMRITIKESTEFKVSSIC